MIVDEVIQNLFCNSASRLAVFIRHGEKTEAETGPALITSQAKSDVDSMGLRFRALNVPVKVYSSPELRCVQTAKIFNSKISDGNSDIILTSFLGEPGIQVRDNKKYLELFDKSGARTIYDEWKNNQHYDALRTKEELRVALAGFLEKTPDDSKISLFVSQSGTVAALGYALGLSNYNIGKKEWVPFLGGLVIPY